MDARSPKFILSYIFRTTLYPRVSLYPGVSLYPRVLKSNTIVAIVQPFQAFRGVGGRIDAKVHPFDHE
jgi:hypothetical protein